MSENQYAGQDDEVVGRALWQRTMVRLVIGLVIIAVIAIVIGGIVYLSYRSSRGEPIKVKVYPGAQEISNEKISDGYDHQQYVSTDPVEQIEVFYGSQDDMNCTRQYDYSRDPAEYQFTSCIIDKSSLDMTQYTSVVIQPVHDESGNLTGQVVIDVKRYWEG
ncbi:MAG: hypothetical protein JXQ72_12775 [Anaerolineae bacterium]|nr:hypothetical protein [Anaerolineae bacterium]